MRDTGHGEAAAVQLTDPHFSIHGLIVAHNSPGVHPESHLTLGLLFDFLGKFLKLQDPYGAFGGQGSDLKEVFRLSLGSLAGEQKRQKECWEKSKEVVHKISGRGINSPWMIDQMS